MPQGIGQIHGRATENYETRMIRPLFRTSPSHRLLEGYGRGHITGLLPYLLSFPSDLVVGSLSERIWGYIDPGSEQVLLA